MLQLHIYMVIFSPLYFLHFVARGDICPGAGPAAKAPRCQALLSQQDRLLRGMELRPRAQPADRPAYKAGVTLPVRKQ